MDYTVQQLDEMCGRIDGLVKQIEQGIANGREEQAVKEVVEMVQRVGEGIAWAYGQHNRRGLGEQFAQPFVDRRMRDKLKALLPSHDEANERRLRRELQQRLSAQILQTIHILLQATPAESTLFSYLTAGWYLNEVVSAHFDFRENEDLLPLWMTVVKDIATMLNKDNMMLFYDPCGDKPFPIFSEAMKFYHHPVSQVRTHVQATSLEIFLKLRDESVWAEPLYQLVVKESAFFFTHVSCLLREFWRMVDEAMSTGNRRDVRSALYIQNDILLYVNDVFACEIPQLSAILQEKLLTFAVLSVLVRSLFRPQAKRGPQERERDLLAPATSWFLLHDALTTLRSGTVMTVLASVLLRSQLPEEVLRIVASHPPRTPRAYLATLASWGGASRSNVFDFDESVPDEALYALRPVPLLELLDRRTTAKPFQRNWLLDALEGLLMGLGSGGNEVASMAVSLLGVTAMLVQGIRTAQEGLATDVAERLAGALCGVLGFYRQLSWAALEAAFCALREVSTAADVPQGRAKVVLGPILKEKVLAPLATDLLEISKHAAANPHSQEAWIQECSDEWASHHTRIPETCAGARQQDFLEPGPSLGPPEAHARGLRALLCARRLGLTLAGATPEGPRSDEPWLDEREAEDAAKYQCGVPVHIGKMNRVKCQVRNPRKPSEMEPLYLLPVESVLVLVRPDEQKPFWAVPVVVEPLRRVRFAQAPDKTTVGPLEQILPPGGNTEDPQRLLRLEVASPQSPFLRVLGGTGADAARPQAASPDRLATTVPAPSALAGGVPDRIAATQPMAAVANAGEGQSQVASLYFSDERRKRVASKIFAQARHRVCLRMAERLEAFLVSQRHDWR